MVLIADGGSMTYIKEFLLSRDCCGFHFTKT